LIDFRADTDVESELAKARDRIGKLEAAVSARCNHDTESSHAADEVARLEDRIRELVGREDQLSAELERARLAENQLNAELESTRLADHRRTLQQNQQVLPLTVQTEDSLNQLVCCSACYTHTLTRLTALCPGLPG